MAIVLRNPNNGYSNTNNRVDRYNDCWGYTHKHTHVSITCTSGNAVGQIRVVIALAPISNVISQSNSIVQSAFQLQTVYSHTKKKNNKPI